MTELINPPADSKPEESKESVPVSELLAVKASLEKAHKQLDSITQDVAQRDARIKELENQSSANPNQDEMLAEKKKLYEQRKELLSMQRELAKRQEDIDSKERTALVTSIASEYEVKPAELANFKTAAEMRAYAADKALKAVKKGQGNNPKYESSSPQSGGKLVTAMTDKEFEEHLATLRKQSLARR